MTDVGKWADYLADAEQTRTPVDPISTLEPALTVEQGYLIQAELVRRKVVDGQVVVGAKAGLTSRAKQLSMGVAEPIFGMLTSGMVLPLEEPLVCANYIHPRVEPEVVFLLGRDLPGPGVTAADVVAASAAVCCGLEVLDSRYADFRFTLPDVVADNTSAAGFVLGPRQVPPDFDLSLVGCLLEVNGAVHSTAAGAAVLGHPAEAVALLANRLAGRGELLRAGWQVLSGGLTEAVPLRPGDHVRAEFGRLGSVGVRAV